jgi:translation elongation factor EF-1beta
MKEREIINKKRWLDLNPKREPLTVEKLRQLVKRELTDQEANEIVFGIEALVNIIMEYQRDREIEKTENDNNNLNQAA